MKLMMMVICGEVAAKNLPKRSQYVFYRYQAFYLDETNKGSKVFRPHKESSESYSEIFCLIVLSASYVFAGSWPILNNYSILIGRITAFLPGRLLLRRRQSIFEAWIAD